jgi:hypothetical protein
MHQFMQAPARHTQQTSRLGLRQSQRLQTITRQQTPRMGRCAQGHTVRGQGLTVTRHSRSVFEGAVAGDHGADNALTAHDVFSDRGIHMQDDEHHQDPHAHMVPSVYVL